MNHIAARRHMVECQIATNRIDDPRLLAALGAVPRELFLPKSWRTCAYVDRDIPLAANRWVAAPLVIAQLLSAVRPRPSDVALVLGDGSGYLCAVLSRLVQTVVGVEPDADLIERANQVLLDQAMDNVVLVQGTPDKGYAAQAPYDLIILAGSVAAIPAGLERQLADGGRLSAVVRSTPGRMFGRGRLLVRVGDTFGQRDMFDAALSCLAS